MGLCIQPGNQRSEDVSSMHFACWRRSEAAYYAIVARHGNEFRLPIAEMRRIPLLFLVYETESAELDDIATLKNFIAAVLVVDPQSVERIVIDDLVVTVAILDDCVFTRNGHVVQEDIATDISSDNELIRPEFIYSPFLLAAQDAQICMRRGMLTKRNQIGR